MKSKKQLVRGFTLIELLIVIAIIGILSSTLLVGLGGARSSARDARRISDLKSVQTALELYFNANGMYPTVVSNNWNDVSGPLGAMNIKIPNDPTPGKTYEYGVDSTLNPQKYTLKATLEAGNQALNDDADNIPGSSGNNGLNCGTNGTGEREYCVTSG